MINISRWNSPEIPTPRQIANELKKINFFVSSHPLPRDYQSEETTLEHKTIYWLAKGDATFNISGQTYVLAPGDKLEVYQNATLSYQCKTETGSHLMIGQDLTQTI